MQALVKTKAGEGHLDLLDISIPEPGPGQVLVASKAVGICGTDIHVFHDRAENRPPVVLGHEFSGEIAAIGRGVTGWKPGDRVVSETTVESCGTCRYCRMGAYDICPTRRGLGRTGDGAFADYLVMPAEMLHRLPDEVGWIEGAFTEPLACCTHAVGEFTCVHAGDVALVIGDGAIGNLCAQIARAEGATVVLAGHHEERLGIAKSVGIEHAVMSDQAGSLVLKLTQGYGADIVVECTGSASGINLGLQVSRKQGQYTQIGLVGVEIGIRFDRICQKELRVQGSFNQQWTSWERALSYLQSGAIRVLPLVSAVLPLNMWAEGFDMYERREALKVILIPEEQVYREWQKHHDTGRH